jgi:hypothetical protein
MSQQFKARYSYSLRLDTQGQVFTESSEMTKKEIQEFVDRSLGLMTAGCEQCVYSQRLFCEKLGRPVKVGDTRCSFFSRRPSAALQY